MAAIEVDDLVVRYGQFTAVDRVTCTVHAGEVVALLGPNGAGKTSTVETLEGFRRPDGGQVRVLGLDPIAHHDQLATRIGVMLQEGGVYPGIKAIEVLRLYASFFVDAADPDELLDRVGLRPRREAMWRHLSGGEQQRLSLALALVGSPEAAFLDEPTAGIDVTGRQLVRQVVQDLAADGAAVLMTTHDLAEAEKTADRVVIIDHGRVVASGTPAELMSSSERADIRFGAPAGLDTAALGKVLATTVDEVSSGEYLVGAPPTPANIAQITAWLAERDLPLADLRAGRQRLEDVFLSLTQITGEHKAITLEDGSHPPTPSKTRGRRLRQHPRQTRRRRD